MKPLDARILDLYESLTPAERRLADVVLEHQPDFASYSATELARRADVSKATAVRLFRRLGYASFDDARRKARSLRHWGSALNDLKNVDLGDSEHPNLATHMRTDMANITRTFEAAGTENIERAVELLSKAPRVWVIGFRSSEPLASIFHFWLSVVRREVRLIRGDGLFFAETAIDMRPGDAAVAIGFRRRTRMLKALLAYTKKANLKVVVIADLSASATAKMADVVLRCHTRPSYVFDSYVAAMSLINYLTAAIALRLGKPSKKRMSQIEDLHNELDLSVVPVLLQKNN